MRIPDLFTRRAALLASAVLLCASLSVYAGGIEDASKLFKQGQHSQALDMVNEYLINNPKDAQARFLKGLILTEQGKTADAIKMFSALTEDYPDLPEPYNNLAVLYASQGQYDRAKMLLEKAISTHPSYATAHENLGDIYAKMASQAYDRALQLDHGNTATQTKLAMIQNLFAGGTRTTEIVAQNTPALDKAEAEQAGTEVKPAEPDQPGSVAAARESKTVTEPVSAPEQVAKKNPGKEVSETVMAWATAWSARNSDKYLSFYADDFKTPGGETRAVWETTRRERVSTPKYIHVGISIKSISFADSAHATVKFRQAYRASHLRTTGNKTLQLAKSGDKWLIEAEIAR